MASSASSSMSAGRKNSTELVCWDAGTDASRANSRSEKKVDNGELMLAGVESRRNGELVLADMESRPSTDASRANSRSEKKTVGGELMLAGVVSSKSEPSIAVRVCSLLVGSS